MESLGVDVKLLIAQIVNFFLFFLIFKKFIAKPFSQFLITEKKKEEEKEKILADLKQKEEDFNKKKEKEAQKLKEEQKRMIKELKEEMKKMRETMILEAKKESEVIIEKSRKQAENYQKKVNPKKLTKRVKELSLKIVAEVLGKVLTPSLQKELNQKILHSLKDIKTELQKTIN
jgi:F-type H+-transporting ATPase subunit b